MYVVRKLSEGWYSVIVPASYSDKVFHLIEHPKVPKRCYLVENDKWVTAMLGDFTYGRLLFEAVWSIQNFEAKHHRPIIRLEDDKFTVSTYDLKRFQDLLTALEFMGEVYCSVANGGEKHVMKLYDIQIRWCELEFRRFEPILFQKEDEVNVE